MVLTRKQKRDFIKNGYLIVPDAIPPELLQNALDFVDHAYDTHQYHQNGMQRLGSQFPTQGFYKPAKRNPAIVALLRETELWKATEELLGEGNSDLRLEQGQIAFNDPTEVYIAEGRGMDEMVPKGYWHVDVGHDEYKPLGADFDVLVGVALTPGQEIDESRGQLCVWPGSHMLTHPVLSEQVRNRDPDEDGKIRCRKIDIGLPIRLLLKAGDACIAHQRLAHCPGLNMSQITRKNIYFRVLHKRHDELREQHLLDPLPFTAFEGIKNMVRKLTKRPDEELTEQNNEEE